jgi:predicted nucleic acid-binding protein
VLDVSVPLTWFLHPVTLDQTSVQYAGSVSKQLTLGNRALVPSLWHLEIANGIATSLRFKIITPEEADQVLIWAEGLLNKAIETAHETVTVRRALTTARTFQLSAYDAVYLELARTESLPLATLDKKLRNAAERAGVEIYRT